MKDTVAMKEFSDKVREGKKALGMAHTDFASFLGVPRDTAVKWVQGKTMPNSAKKASILKKIADKLDA